MRCLLHTAVNCILCGKSSCYKAVVQVVLPIFTANAIPDDKKVAVFLTAIRSQTYSLVISLVAPTMPQDNSLADLVDVLKRHFEPKPLVIAERFHFHKRAQAVGESIAEYMAELRRLTTHCNYRDHLEEALRDRLVCGSVMWTQRGNYSLYQTLH